MIVRWTPTALRDLESLHAFISNDHPEAAAGMVDKILAGVDTLPNYPHIGRQGRVAGTRELVVPPYVIAYRLRRGGIELMAIIHSARRWPDSF